MSLFYVDGFPGDLSIYLSIKTRSLRYLTETITGADYADDLIFSQIHLPKLNSCCIAWSRQQKALASMWMQIKQSLCSKQFGAFSTLNGKLLKFVTQFTYLGSNISFNERDVNKSKRHVLPLTDHMEKWYLIK